MSLSLAKTKSSRRGLHRRPESPYFMLPTSTSTKTEAFSTPLIWCLVMVMLFLMMGYLGYFVDGPFESLIFE